MSNEIRKFTAYVSNILNNGKVDYMFPLSDNIEGLVIQNLKDEIKSYNKENHLPDGKYIALACRDALIDPEKTTSTNGLANEDGYVVSYNFKVIKGAISEL